MHRSILCHELKKLFICEHGAEFASNWAGVRLEDFSDCIRMCSVSFFYLAEDKPAFAQLPSLNTSSSKDTNPLKLKLILQADTFVKIQEYAEQVKFDNEQECDDEDEGETRKEGLKRETTSRHGSTSLLSKKIVKTTSTSLQRPIARRPLSASIIDLTKASYT